jgi:hypothetical protein
MITVAFDLADDGQEDERRRLVEEIARLQAQLEALPPGDDPGLVRASLQATINGLQSRLAAMNAFNEDEIDDLDVEALDDLIEELDSAINTESDFQTKQYLMRLLAKARAALARKSREDSALRRASTKTVILRAGGDVRTFFPARKGRN